MDQVKQKVSIISKIKERIMLMLEPLTQTDSVVSIAGLNECLSAQNGERIHNLEKMVNYDEATTKAQKVTQASTDKKIDKWKVVDNKGLNVVRPQNIENKQHSIKQKEETQRQIEM